jgi:Superinfection exclusion gene product 17
VRLRKNVVHGVPQEHNPAARLKVWWIPQIPGEPFNWYVETFPEAKTLLDALAQYDIFQLNHKIKPDYSNVGGLMIFEGPPRPTFAEYHDPDNWNDWEDEEGRPIEDLTMRECRAIRAKEILA